MLSVFASDSAVKRKLHNLRTAYARQKYVIEKRRSMAEKPRRVKRWCHYNRLRFLDAVFSPKTWVLQVSYLWYWAVLILRITVISLYYCSVVHSVCRSWKRTFKIWGSLPLKHGPRTSFPQLLTTSQLKCEYLQTEASYWRTEKDF